MYHLKAIAGVLVDLPLDDGKASRRNSNARGRLKVGPPFEMPYTLSLPTKETDCWRLHLDLHRTSQDLCDILRRLRPTPSGKIALRNLKRSDKDAATWILKILDGLGE
jgi:hypothetical protein